MELVTNWIFNLRQEDMCKLAVIPWRSWFRRNSFIHSRLLIPDEDFVGWAVNFLEEYNTENRKPARFKRDYHCWKPPDYGLLKLDTDAAVHFDKNISGLGMVLRDHKGCVKLVGSYPMKQGLPVEVVEAMAIKCGLSVASSHGLWPSVVESDSLQVVNAICNREVIFSELAAVLSEIFAMLSLNFSCDFKFIFRECNQMANALSKSALNCETEAI
ncbi:uncharacterized protein LOC8283387 isoform X2 [Ricinus communis]|uniref:uncharacterized protein LOC8283387 isoform X2 n=1 Tax=Ricinus communis TaxID=3988 RepID=UPI00201A925A|nr:uncharacterized protein LOC8283387 isoform X2 [Ricinus communis]